MMKSTQRYPVLLVLACYLLTAAACFAQRPSGVSRIRGGSHSGNAVGSLSVLTLESPEGHLVVAVKYPRPIDTQWFPGYGGSGNGDDVAHWEEIYKVRYQKEQELVELIVRWEYSSRTRKLSFGGKSFDIPPGKLVLLSYDPDQKPLCEFRDDTPANFDQVRKQFGAQRTGASAAAPAP